MAKAGYSYIWCKVCGKNISASGGGVHHYRMHVRRGEMVETVHDEYSYKKRYSTFRVADGVPVKHEGKWQR